MLISSTILKDAPKDKPFAILGGGCFWCVESEFRRLEGVLFTLSGYGGGDTSNPTYQDVCTGKTGHAEVTKIYFDPSIISYQSLLTHFLTVAHDPTELNRQGVDVGTQYRSVIFYTDDHQRDIAKKVIEDVTNSGRWKKPIATLIEPHTQFWAAEDYHQQYYEKFEENKGVMHPNAFLKMRKWGAL
jgi:peptide-methionine (S)-S-oxide reductase